MRLFQLLTIVVFLNSITCGQLKLVKVVNPNEVLLDIEHIGKKGDVKVFLIENRSQIIDPPIPNTYQLFDKKYYKIETDILAYGDTISSFQVDINPERFSKIRILRRTATEMNINGFEWQDCTITKEKLDNPSDSNYSAKYNERLKKFLPNLQQRRVSCELSEGLKMEEFFLVTMQLQEPPIEPFTKLDWTLGKIQSTQTREKIYELTFTNNGSKDVSEFSFRSVFDIDTRLVAIKPSQGVCKSSRYGTGGSVCHLGKILVGKSVHIEFKSENNGMSNNTSISNIENEHWYIWGIQKESSNDPNWEVNNVWFEPISKINLLKK